MADSNAESSSQEEALGVYIMPNSMSKNYVADLKKASAKNQQISLADNFDFDDVDVIVSNLEDASAVIKALKIEKQAISDPERYVYVVNLKWLTDSNKRGQVCDKRDSKYFIARLKNGKISGSEETSPSSSGKAKAQARIKLEDFELPDYECQRATPLRHFNEELTNVLEILEDNAFYKGTDNDDARALAFRHCICVLKCLPARVTDARQIKHIKHVGQHTYKVIDDILTFGESEEVNAILADEFYQASKIFNSIFGCGPAVAHRLYSEGFRTLEDLREAYRSDHDSFSRRLLSDFERFKYGLVYHEDLVVDSISRKECLWIVDKLSYLLQELIDPGCQIHLMGGFKREQESGHDIDLLLTHGVLGEEKHLLGKLMEKLEKCGLVVYGKHQKESEHDWTSKAFSKNKFDHFARYICILKFPKFKEETGRKRMKVDDNEELFREKSEHELKEQEVLLEKILKSADASKFERDWVARRFDFIITPIDQLPFAILGWTGSRQFVRSIRLYSEREFGWRLTSHGIYDHKKKELLAAKTEKDIFDLLKLTYREPRDRNC